MPHVGRFDFQIKYTETDKNSHWHEIDLHTHSEFEFYINLSGDVSFLVKDRIYPVSRGDVVMVRPGELHHCFYHSDKPHKFFWILFDCKKNKNLLDALKDENENCLFSPKGELRGEL
jgi:oxalate decarboxylase/phosphoglucose isomerase-like protein (cupin superfamily)